MAKRRLGKKLLVVLSKLKPEKRRRPKPRRKIRILFTCGLGEGSSYYYVKRFVESLKHYGFRPSDFEIRTARTLTVQKTWIDKELRLYNQKLVTKPPSALLEQAQGFDYVIHRFTDAADAIRGKKELGKTVVMTADEAGYGTGDISKKSKREPFKPLIKHMIKNHLRPAQKTEKAKAAKKAAKTI